MPKTWLVATINQAIDHSITIELVKHVVEKKASNIEVEEKVEPPKPLFDTKQSKPTEAPPKPINTVITSTEPKPSVEEHPNQSATSKSVPDIDASDVQIMMSKVIDPKILNDDFSVRKNNNQFIAKQYTVADKYADLPYLDESIDAPRIQMAFYSEGFMGNIERFFDKITFEKTFTTKYGTKIHCAVVGVLAMCGWK